MKNGRGLFLAALVVLLGVGYAVHKWWPWSLVGVVVIMLIVAVVAATLRKPAATTVPTTGTATPASRTSTWGILAGIAAFLIVGWLAFGLGSCFLDTGKGIKHRLGTSKPATAHPPAPATQPVESLVLEHECLTPCSANISYRFEVIWGDSPLRITYPGGQIVDRRGKDEDFQAPSNIRSGETKFVSLDPLRPNFRVRVYRVTRR